MRAGEVCSQADIPDIPKPALVPPWRNLVRVIQAAACTFMTRRFQPQARVKLTGAVQSGYHSDGPWMWIQYRRRRWRHLAVFIRKSVGAQAVMEAPFWGPGKMARFSLIFGDDPRQAHRITRYLMAVGSSLLVLALMYLLYRQGDLDPAGFRYAAAAMLFCFVLFYLLFRTGLNLRMRDPSLTVAQIRVAAGAELCHVLRLQRHAPAVSHDFPDDLAVQSFSH